MKPDTFGRRTTQQLMGLSPLLDAWIKVLNRSLQADKYNDAPWWYNERATLSTLAGAAWSLEKWTALEEFSTTKRGVVPGKNVEHGELVRGRCDLYVSHGSTDFAIEAKQAWEPMAFSYKSKHIHQAMQAARADAGNLTADQGDHRVALVFVVPFIPVARVSKGMRYGKHVVDQDLAQEAVGAWLKDLGLESYDAVAYNFPRKCREFVSKGRLFPGVLLVAERIKTGTKRTSKTKAQK